MTPLQRYSISDHAVTRFQERVRPGLGYLDAKSEFRRLLHAFGEPVARPDWMVTARGEPVDTTAAWVAVGDVYACCTRLPDGCLRVRTVITFRSLSPAARRLRTDRKRRSSRRAA